MEEFNAEKQVIFGDEDRKVSFQLRPKDNTVVIMEQLDDETTFFSVTPGELLAAAIQLQEQCREIERERQAIRFKAL